MGKATPMNEIRMVLKEGERVRIKFVLSDGSEAGEYAVVEYRPPNYTSGDGRQRASRSDACGAVAMKFASGNGAWQVLGLTPSGLAQRPKAVDDLTRLMCKAHDALNTARFEANGKWDEDFDNEVQEIQTQLKQAVGL